jgi:cell division protease FtsH
MNESGNQNDPPEEPRRGQGGPPRVPRPAFGWLLFAAIGLMLVLMLSGNWNQGAEDISITQFWSLVDNHQIVKLTVKDSMLEGQRRAAQGDEPGETGRFIVKYPPGAIDQKLIDRLTAECPDAQIAYEENPYFLTILISLIPWILILGFLWFFVIRQLRSAGGGPGGMLGSFGRSRHKVTSKEHTNITFEDVAGIDEAKEEVTEIIEFLRNPKRFARLGGRIPRGVLLVGNPGCGKTLLAKAIAGEAEVPFFSISGSDFVEMFVGVGASRVRDLFKQAKENAPCIIFLDEIDAVGRRRGAGFSTGGHDEREQTLNAILVEMDGFDTSDQVIVIAATNRVDVLDPALIRPGRFDREVFVPLPDIKGRLGILKVHARNVKLSPEVNLERIARGTPMFSGADLAAIINEAALIATMQNKDFVEMDDLEEARDKVRWGRAKKSRIIDEEEKKATAYHEAGHALVQLTVEGADPVHKVSIIPRGPYGGATFSLPEKDRSNYSRKYLQAMMRVACAGRIAEEMFCKEVNTGAYGDIRQATDMARKMITDWGMNERLGFVYYGSEHETRNPWFDMPGGREYSEKTQQLIDEEVKQLLDQAYGDARHILEGNRQELQTVAEALLKYETLTGEEIQALMRGEHITRPTISDLLDAERAAPPQKARPAKPGPDDLPHLGEGPLPQPG